MSRSDFWNNLAPERQKTVKPHQPDRGCECRCIRIRWSGLIIIKITRRTLAKLSKLTYLCTIPVLFCNLDVAKTLIFTSHDAATKADIRR